MPRATHTQRDLVHIQVMMMAPDYEFQVSDIQNGIDDAYDEKSVSDHTIRAVLKTLRDEGLVQHSDDGKHFIRNF